MNAKIEFLFFILLSCFLLTTYYCGEDTTNSQGETSNSEEIVGDRSSVDSASQDTSSIDFSFNTEEEVMAMVESYKPILEERNALLSSLESTADIDQTVLNKLQEYQTEEEEMQQKLQTKDRGFQQQFVRLLLTSEVHREYLNIYTKILNEEEMYNKLGDYLEATQY